MVGNSWTWTVTLSRVCTKTWPEEVMGWLWGEGLRSLRSKVTLRAKGRDIVTPQGRRRWLPGVQHPWLRGWQRHEMSTNFLNLHLQVQPWFLPVYATRVRNHGNTIWGDSISSPFTNTLTSHHPVRPSWDTVLNNFCVKIHQWLSCHHFWSLAIILFYLSLEMPPLTRESISPCFFPSLIHPVLLPPEILVLLLTSSTFFRAVETSPLPTASVATLTCRTCPHGEVVAQLR